LHAIDIVSLPTVSLLFIRNTSPCTMHIVSTTKFNLTIHVVQHHIHHDLPSHVWHCAAWD